MCIKDEKMTNSQVLQLIIEELSKTKLTWNNDKELFELICSPLSYGLEIYQKRKNTKDAILNIFNNNNNFDKNRFDVLADNIICGANQTKHRNELLDFLKTFDIPTQTDINLLVNEIPCKSKNEQNYKSSFHNWKKGKIKRINKQIVKKQLEQNFDFPPSLWDKGEIFIKTAIKDGVSKFVKRHTCKNILVFDNLKKEFNMNTTITQSEIQELENIKQMTHADIMEFIGKQDPLAKNCSQEFIQKIIPILYGKGHYELLLNDLIPVLDMNLRNTKQIKKIEADIYSIIGEYRKAMDVLSIIKADNDAELIDIKTAEISNMRRHLLYYTKSSKEEKKETIKKLISYYQEIFEFNETYNYYPAINLVYILVMSSLFYNPKQIQQDLKDTINTIYEKTKKTIHTDKKSANLKDKYYANITELEFLLLKGDENIVAELERYLAINKDELSLTELGRTQRQMQFFTDTIINLHGSDTPVVERMQRAIEVIDDFTEFYEK
jgi:hypothetical protein